MGKKSRIVPQRIPTKKQLSHWQREERIRRITLMSAAVVIFIIVAIPVFGFTREYVLKGRETVARVNQSALNLSDYAKLLGLRQFLIDNQISSLQRITGAQASSQLQSSIQNLQQLRSQLPDQVVQDWVSEQLMQAEASRLGISVSPDEVTASIRSQFDPAYAQSRETPTPAPTQEAQPTGTPGQGAQPSPTPGQQPLTDQQFQAKYQDFLKQSGTTDALYRSLVEDPLLRVRLEDNLVKDVQSPAPQVHLLAIIAGTESEASQVLDRLNQGEDFAKVAQEVSLDQQSADNGGDLGWTPRGLMDQNLEDAVFSANVGELGGPIEASQGYVVFLVSERDDSRVIDPATLEKVKAALLARWLVQAEGASQISRLLTSDMIVWAEKQAPKQ
ncbi:MAG: peptidylprolyl isomerase [Dehalococcoidia bacterium]|nr:peptidylprolyl isomerase [Dehalococcoidia bacterium]